LFGGTTGVVDGTAPVAGAAAPAAVFPPPAGAGAGIPATGAAGALDTIANSEKALITIAETVDVFFISIAP
jgi:hypothetical protein